jgi:hypothetical protein
MNIIVKGILHIVNMGDTLFAFQDELVDRLLFIK